MSFGRKTFFMKTCLYYLFSIAYFNHMLYIHFNIFFSPHSPLDGVDHLIRLLYPNHPPSSFSIYTASFHPQTSTLTHEPWPSPPKVQNECFNVDACASLDRCSNVLFSISSRSFGLPSTRFSIRTKIYSDFFTR